MRNNGLLRNWVVFLEILIIVLGVPALFRSSATYSFDETTLKVLRSVTPEYVFIGNSMLYTRIDERHLNNLLGGNKAILLTSGGDMSSIWYLRLKNHVAASGIQPKAVFIFFRNDELTKPMNRINGMYEEKIRQLMNGDEREFNGVIEANETFREKAGKIIKAFYPKLIESRDEAEKSIQSLAMSPFVGTGISQLWRRESQNPASRPAHFGTQQTNNQWKDKAIFQKTVNELFAFSKLRKTYYGDYEEKSAEIKYDFENDVKKSFLPLMMETASDNHLKLVFVRVQKRPLPEGPLKDSQSLDKYVDDLRRYVESRGMVFYDFNGDPALPLEVYQEGDHVSEKYKKYYTELFMRRLSGVFN